METESISGRAGNRLCGTASRRASLSLRRSLRRLRNRCRQQAPRPLDEPCRRWSERRLTPLRGSLRATQNDAWCNSRIRPKSAFSRLRPFTVPIFKVRSGSSAVGRPAILKVGRPTGGDAYAGVKALFDAKYGWSDGLIVELTPA
jgi:hypothetical protein